MAWTNELAIWVLPSPHAVDGRSIGADPPSFSWSVAYTAIARLERGSSIAGWNDKQIRYNSRLGAPGVTSAG
jgi:hypothetical protein